MKMRIQKTQLGLAFITASCVILCTTSLAQVRTIPKEGLEGLSKEALEFEIEHNYRRESGLGGTVPAEPGTRPGSTNPQNIEGIWLRGKNYSINADGSYSEASNTPPAGMAAAAAGMAAAPPAGGMGTGTAAAPRCTLSLSFAMASPSKIIQTDQVMYIFHTSAGYRRIEMNAAHPANLKPTVLGHSIGRWQGDTLTIETVGVLGGSASSGPGNTAARLSSNSKITEQLKKFEGGLKLEQLITIEDMQTGQTSKQRLVSYYRPDLQYVEAPCEEYSDPFEGQYITTGAAAAAAPASK